MDTMTSQNTVQPAPNVRDAARCVFNAETYLIDIESALLGMEILAEADLSSGDERGGLFASYLSNRLQEHTLALRKALFPDEQLPN